MSVSGPSGVPDGWDVTLLEGPQGERGVRFVAADHPLPDIAMDALLEATRAVAKAKPLEPSENPFLQAVQRAAARVRAPSRAVAKAGRSPAELAVRAAAKHATPGRASAVRKSAGRTFAAVVADLRAKGRA
jgi:hypothetical protein